MEVDEVQLLQQLGKDMKTLLECEGEMADQSFLHSFTVLDGSVTSSPHLSLLISRSLPRDCKSPVPPCSHHQPS